MLNLLIAPARRDGLELGIVMEHVAEIPRIVGAVLLHQTRRLDDTQDLRIDLRRVEPVPRDIVQRP
jgi:hypothetical protein